MTTNRNNNSWTITWNRLVRMVQQDFTLEYMDDADPSTILDLRIKAVWPGDKLELEIYSHRSDNRLGSLMISKAHNAIMRLRGNSVTVVPELPHGVHPGLEIRFYELAPVSAAVLKGCNYKKRQKQ